MYSIVRGSPLMTVRTVASVSEPAHGLLPQQPRHFSEIATQASALFADLRVVIHLLPVALRYNSKVLLEGRAA